jgi:hypothetical protein
MVEAKATGSESEGQHSVAKRLKTISESPPGPRSVGPGGRWILAENKARAKRINDPEEVRAEVLDGPLVDPAGLRIPLAWVASADEINVQALPQFGGEIADIPEPGDAGPVPREHPEGMRVLLDLPAALHAGPGEPEVDPADPREQAPEGESQSLAPRQATAAARAGAAGARSWNGTSE